MKKLEIKKNISFKKIYFGVLFLLGISLIFAAHIITISEGLPSYNFNEDTSSFYNITVNNTDALYTNNITQVNITLPSSFTFLGETNGTNAPNNLFSNTSLILSWTNNSLLVENSTSKNFWFNASASTPGTYNLTIRTLNQSGVYSSNISVLINDTTSPSSLSFVYPSDNNSATLSRTYIKYNFSASDNGVLDTIKVDLYDSDYSLVNTSSSKTIPFYGNFSNLSQDRYYINATINDTFGNIKNSETREITLKTSPPEMDLIYPPALGTINSSPYNFTFDVASSLGVEITNCSLMINGTTVNFTTSIGSRNRILRNVTNGFYNWNVNCTDEAGNKGGSVKNTFVVNLVTNSGNNGGGDSSSGNNPSNDYVNISLNRSQISEGTNKVVSKNVELKFEINNEPHSVKIQNVTSSNVKIIVSSTPQEATLLVGEEKKFELNGDNYTDLKIKLNSITSSSQANITIKEIHEIISTRSSSSGSSNNSSNSSESEQENSKNKGVILLIIIISVLIILVVFAIIYFFKKKNSNKDSESKDGINPLINNPPAFNPPSNTPVYPSNPYLKPQTNNPVNRYPSSQTLPPQRTYIPPNNQKQPSY